MDGISFVHNFDQVRYGFSNYFLSLQQMKYIWLGFLGSIVAASSLLPTMYTVIKQKSTHSINYLYIALAFFAQLIWFLYSFLNKDFPLLFLSVYLMIVYIVILFNKWYYESTNQDVYSKLKHNCNK